MNNPPFLILGVKFLSELALDERGLLPRFGVINSLTPERRSIELDLLDKVETRGIKLLATDDCLKSKHCVIRILFLYKHL